ncbi:MAG: hypothetical protein JWR32_2038 [Mycobacterium sp.]|jgi:hypothetical protein|nr:hypothetical protein [Mycobacterium sp.]
MTLWHERNPVEYRNPGPVASSRLRMKPTLSGTGHVDGAWWPPTDELAVALPDLVALLPPRLGPITQVLYHPHGWAAGVPRRVSRGKQAVRLDGYHYQPADTIDLISEDGTRLVLLVVPATTDPWVAEFILSAAADNHDVSTTSELLALRTEDTVEPDASIAAHQNWESEGGKSIGVPSLPDP